MEFKNYIFLFIFIIILFCSVIAILMKYVPLRFNEVKKYFFIFIFIIIIFCFFITILIRYEFKRNKEFNSKFTILTQKERINATVYEIHILERVRIPSSVVYISLSDNKNYRINTISNPDSLKNNISFNIDIGDRIKKDANNDTIYIIKKPLYENNKAIFFILKKDKIE